MSTQSVRHISGRHAPAKTLRLGVLYALLFGVLLALTYDAEYSGDMETWMRWATHLFHRGLADAYALPDNDYNPLYQYVLWAYGQVMGSADNIVQHRHALKGVTLAFDFAAAILVVSLLRGSWQRFIGSLWLLLNLGYLYNTLIWQQVDGIFTALTFAATLLALRDRPGPSMICYTLALNAKLQAIVFLPFLLLLWLPAWARRPRTLWQSVLLAVIVQTVVLAPFVWGGEQSYLDRIISLNLRAANVYPYVTVNAYNVWVLLMPKAALAWTSDALVKLGLTYKNWGLLAFMGASAVALLPLLLLVMRRLGRRAAFEPADYPLVLLTGALLPLLFCYFNTEMHERYWHPSILFLGAYALLARTYWIYGLASVAYVLNLEGVQLYFGWFDKPAVPTVAYVVAWLFTIAILGCLHHLYKLARHSAEWFIPR